MSLCESSEIAFHVHRVKTPSYAISPGLCVNIYADELHRVRGQRAFVVLQSIEHGQEIMRIPSTPVWLSAFNEARLGSSTWSLLQCRGLSS